jgi:hypothetical protein
MVHTPYKFPGKLLFRHLKQHEVFYFKSGDTGPFMKISARRYVPVTVTLSGHKIIPHWDTSKGVFWGAVPYAPQICFLFIICLFLCRMIVAHIRHWP